MHTCIVRVWLPDRPGALGAVASRIGAARGDVVGIEILERGAGRAIDELVVHLPDADLVDLLVSEISQVDGVDVEEVRTATERISDPRFEALEMAAAIVGAADEDELFSILVRQAVRAIDAEWGTIVDTEQSRVVAQEGASPTAEWVLAFVQGAANGGTADDVVSVNLDAAGVVLALGRERAAFRDRQRRHVAMLAQIADEVLPSV